MVRVEDCLEAVEPTEGEVLGNQDFLMMGEEHHFRFEVASEQREAMKPKSIIIFGDKESSILVGLCELVLSDRRQAV